MEKMKEQICTTIMSAHTVQEAVQGVHTLARINTEFNNAFINKPLITRDIVGLLVAKFGGYHENIAQLLATKGAKHYRRKQIKFLQQWATIFDPSNDNDLIVYDKFDVVMALILGSGADLGFSNAQGLTPLYAVMMPFIDIETLSEAQRVVYAKSIVRVVRLIMRYGGKHRVLQPQPLNKRSLLSIAVKLSAWTNNTNLVTTLLDVGLSADVLNSDMGYTGTPLHDATVIGDTVGDPFKDTSSVALNPVIKFTTLFGLLAVELAVKLTATSGGTLTRALAAAFFVVSFIFVYRSFYSMRIRQSN